MKFTTYLRDGVPRLAVVDGHHIVELNDFDAAIEPDLRMALRSGKDIVEAGRRAIAAGAARAAFEGQRLAPLVPEPGKVVCLGLNYFDHAKEGGREKPDYPWFFLRCATSLLAHGEAGVVPAVSDRFDYESELAVVIGKRVPRHVRQEDALQYVFGYACFNDMSVRDYQKRTPQWTIGKNFDRTGGFGPVLVTADELPPGATGLKVQGLLNGEVMQAANTSDMIFGVAETIVLLADVMTLEPGDVIVMGTPAGVGQARTPPVWMKPGDRFEVRIESVGSLVNPIVAEES